MGLIREFARSFREDDTLEAGLFQKGDGTVWLRNPDGTETQVAGGGSQPGVWKTYGVDSSNQALGGITGGNGTLIGRWWTPAIVVASDVTDPFLCIVYVNFRLGSTSSVDGAISFSLPTLVDGSGFNLVPADTAEANGFAEASGIGDFPGAAIAGGGLFGGDGTAWDATHPFTWGAAHNLVISVTFLARFAAN